MQNKLLARQIKRYLKDSPVPDNMQALLQAISDSYDHYEQDRQLLERSLELSSQELTGAYRTLEEKSKQIEEFNKNITDSIRYAKRIQEAILPSNAKMRTLLGDHFILYKPKDIVSGDFFYVNKKGGKVYLSTADCTGHGVPGAFMSLLSTSYLNEALNGTDLDDPGKILGYVRQHLIDDLKVRVSQSEEGTAASSLTIQDGMDCSLCAFDFENRRLSSACANNPVWIINDGEFIEVAPDKFPVGKHDRDQVPFSRHDFELKKGSIVYSFTDGYADQFGGPSGKKFKYKQLKELIASIASLDLEEQKQILDRTIEKWKDGLEQIDDILVVAVKM